jgi:hypothetical protein
MLVKKVMLPVAAGMLLWACSTQKKTAQTKIEPTKTMQPVMAKTDTTKKAKVKPYKEVITAKAITDSGLFIVHRVEDKYYFEIPNTLLDRDILTVNRISKAAADVRPQRGFYGYAGDLIGENVIQFSKGPNDKVFIKRISYSDRSSDSSENGMYRSVRNSNLQPIVASFDIKAYTPDSLGVVLDMTDYINGDNDVLFFDGSVKKQFGLATLQADKSYITKVNSFPQNIEVGAVKTYGAAEDNTGTYELNSSIVLLPKDPMRPRYYDARVGYFATGYRDFDANPQEVENTAVITRWRLEPKDEDIEKYKRGELVEPKKPIVFYIDPATPKKWVTYLIQGVNDWQSAFEKAGFKNAIYALEAPKNDPDWSLEDARHNAIIYKPSAIPNAYGPHVHDPRSGEILETHVQWFHNVMWLLHDWYMIQAGAIDPRARTMEFDDSLMGQLIRFVSSHEVGHTLGLAHNFGSSSTVPVDSLRSKRYVEANGHTPSIMDYARFNYVAQPEDHISEKGIFPRIGVYDEWAIEWGYRWLPELKGKEEENIYMNHWIIAKVEKDKRLWYGPQPQNLLGLISDPRCQSEDLGDDAMKAGYYGIENLKRIESQLVQWTRQPNKDFTSLRRMQQQVAAQFSRYIMHVTYNIGYSYFNSKTVEQKGNVVDFVPKKKQKEAVAFLSQQLFQPPLWLLNSEIFSLGAGYDANLPWTMQAAVLWWIVNAGTYSNLNNFQRIHPKEAYGFEELLNDLENEIWKELKKKEPITLYRRNLQKLYIQQLISETELSNPKNDPIIERMNLWTKTTDYLPLVQGRMKNILNELDEALPAYQDKATKIHLMAMRDRLKQALDPNAPLHTVNQSSNQGLNGIERMGMDRNGLPDIPFFKEGEQGCW